MANNLRGRYWVATHNNWTPEDIEAWHDLANDRHNYITYMTWGEEGREEGTYLFPHSVRVRA